MLFNLQAVQERFNQNKTTDPKEEIKQVSTNMIYELRFVNLYKDFFLHLLIDLIVLC